MGRITTATPRLPYPTSEQGPRARTSNFQWTGLALSWLRDGHWQMARIRGNVPPRTPLPLNMTCPALTGGAFYESALTNTLIMLGTGPACLRLRFRQTRSCPHVDYQTDHT